MHPFARLIHVYSRLVSTFIMQRLLYNLQVIGLIFTSYECIENIMKNMHLKFRKIFAYFTRIGRHCTHTYISFPKDRQSHKQVRKNFAYSKGYYVIVSFTKFIKYF